MRNHIHHIIPRHMGGTDEPSNLIELSVSDHAEAHRILYENYGKLEDRLAWLGLSGLIGKTELSIEASRAVWKGKHHTDENILLIRKCALEQWQRPDDIRKTIEHRDMMSKKQKIIQNSVEVNQKRKNTLSKMWKVTNPDGESFVIRNLSDFCKKNNLFDGNMKKVANGIRTHHKKWKCERMD